ncbi:hypothetical protein Tco_1243959 [Tanacetum coccineum]
MRAFLAEYPPVSLSPPITDFIITTCDFQKDLLDWNISPVNDGFDAKALFNMYITKRINDKRLELLESSKLYKVAEQQPQEALNVAKEASFLLHIKNPTQKGRNEFRGLKRKRKPVFPKHLQERFGKLHYHAADPPDFLNYQGAVNIIVLASDDMKALLPYGDPLLRKCEDSLDSLANSAVRLAQSSITWSIIDLCIANIRNEYKENILR